MKKTLVLNTVAVLLIYFCFFLYFYTDKEERINVLLNQQITNLKIHYNITTKYFQITSDATIEMLQSDKTSMGILTKFLDASNEERIILRSQLYNRLNKHYKEMQKEGVLQFHFVLPDNTTSLRVHKPSQFDDNLRELRYSYRYVNKTKESIKGFEEGKTSLSYRHVTPLFGINNQYLGLVDIGFAPEIIQRNLFVSSKIFSHLIIDKNIINLYQWQRNDINAEYKPSIENTSYFEFSNYEQSENRNLNKLMSPVKNTISQKMSEQQNFALYLQTKKNVTIVAFLPIHNINNRLIAYLVSYTDSSNIQNIINNFYIINIIIFIFLILCLIFISKTISYNQLLKSEKEKYKTLSQYDLVTKLPNRTLFYDRLNQSIVRAKRQKKRFSLLFIDIDNFKNINDSYGHNEGDNVLQIVGEKIKHLLRQEDTLARLGGDEFVVILEEVGDKKDIFIVTNKIIRAFYDSISISISNRHYHISVSIGISIFPDDSNNADDLLKYADVAMYKAKESGKNNAQFYLEDMTKKALEKIKLEHELKLALKNEEFIVYYQPQINGDSEQLIGMEALVRWYHPVKGIIPPGQFLPIAEENGMIVELDQWVMKTAMKQMVIWFDKNLNPGVLALNLSMKQLKQKNFIHQLKTILKETGCNPKWIEFEVTESQIMQNPEEAINILHKISNIGIELAIDDFGTGYSSLSYLKRLPLDKLKIDQMFVKNLPFDKDDIAISKSIIALSKSLGLKVIAEGVETESQKEFLVQNGCHNIQGYLYAKPMPADEFEMYIKAIR